MQNSVHVPATTHNPARLVPVVTQADWTGNGPHVPPLGPPAQPLHELPSHAESQHTLGRSLLPLDPQNEYSPGWQSESCTHTWPRPARARGMVPLTARLTASGPALTVMVPRNT